MRLGGGLGWLQIRNEGLKMEVFARLVANKGVTGDFHVNQLHVGVNLLH